MTTGTPSSALSPRVTLALAGLFLICIAINAQDVVGMVRMGPGSHDFRIFRVADTILAEGDGHHLYDYDTQAETQDAVFPELRNAGLLVFNHPAYEALLYLPLLRLPYSVAYGIWSFINVAVIIVTSRVLEPALPLLSESRIPLWLWFFAFYPVAIALGNGQDSLLLALAIVLAYRATLSGKQFLAGLILSLAIFKFHIVLLIAFLVLVPQRRWRSLAGLSLGASLLGLVSLAMVGLDGARDYIEMLRTQQQVTPWGFRATLMPNLRGTIFTAFNGLEQPVLIVITILLSVILMVATFLMLARWSKRAADRPRWDLTFSLAIIAALLCSYHLHISDLSLLVIPMLLFLNRLLGDAEALNASGTSASKLVVALAGFGTCFVYLFRPVVFAINDRLLWKEHWLSLGVIALWTGLMVFISQRNSKLVAASV